MSCDARSPLPLKNPRAKGLTQQTGTYEDTSTSYGTRTLSLTMSGGRTWKQEREIHSHHSYAVYHHMTIKQGEEQRPRKRLFDLYVIKPLNDMMIKQFFHLLFDKKKRHETLYVFSTRQFHIYIC